MILISREPERSRRNEVLQLQLKARGIPRAGGKKKMIDIQAYQMTALREPFERVVYPLPQLAEGEALIEIAGCGLCHTDISFWHHGVPVRHELPLTLGHEISGTVLDGPSQWLGKPVVVPAVLPCGECDLCRRGRSNICQNQQMPGNDFHGGFASHVVVPARFLCEVPESVFYRYKLAELAVVADAISTSYQAVKKSGLEDGDLAIVIGVGGVGIYAAQLARILGATVLAIDVSAKRLSGLARIEIANRINSTGKTVTEIKSEVKALCKDLRAQQQGWKIFEMSGTRAGQELAYALLGVAGTLSVVGFTMEKLEIRLSNLMAFDAQIIGTWGCRAELYPEVMNLIAAGKLVIKPYIETFPLSQINRVFRDVLVNKLEKRAILIPDFGENKN